MRDRDADADTDEPPFRRLARAWVDVGLERGLPFECPYLPGRTARHALVAAPWLPPGMYQTLMDLNFRRMGQVYYRPECDGCRACRMLRVRVGEHRPTRAERRCLARNADLDVQVGPPRASEEKLRLYQRYLDMRHGVRPDDVREEFEGLLYAAPPSSLEVCYRVAGRLLGVGLADAEPGALSAVYSFYDPDQARRSLGVYNVLWLIGECRRRRVPYLYLGYHVEGCRKMVYKARFQPHDLWLAEGRWESLPARP